MKLTIQDLDRIHTERSYMPYYDRPVAYNHLVRIIEANLHRLSLEDRLCLVDHLFTQDEAIHLEAWVQTNIP